MALKKLKGARLTTPAAEIDEMKPMGRGMTAAGEDLIGNRRRDGFGVDSHLTDYDRFAVPVSFFLNPFPSGPLKPALTRETPIRMPGDLEETTYRARDGVPVLRYYHTLVTLCEGV